MPSNLKLRRISELTGLMETRLAGCPVREMVRWLRNSVRTFCQETESLVETLPAITTVVDQQSYALASALDAEIHRVTEVTIRDADSVAADLEVAPLHSSRWDYDPSTGLLELMFKPTVAVTGGMTVKAVVMLSYQSDEIPAWWLNRYEAAFVAGAMSELQSMSGVPWSNPVEAKRNADRFQTMIGRAKNAVQLGYKAVVPRIDLDSCTDRVGTISNW